MKTYSCIAALLTVVFAGGCLIDDTGATRGRPDAPSASVPDSGSPVRRESPAETLNEAREPSSPDKSKGTLDVEGRVNE